MTYKNIYPNIDWVFSVKNGQMKHEFVVRKGGNVADIHLQYLGADKIEINEDGSLTAITSMGNVIEAAPISFTNNNEDVRTSYVLDGNILSYDVEDYYCELTIDPSLKWTSYYGSANLEYF